MQLCTKRAGISCNQKRPWRAKRIFHVLFPRIHQSH